MGLRSAVPWWARVAGKLVLSRLPVSYDFWRRLSLFRHGQMDRCDYALGVFREHLSRAGFEERSGYTVLEQGPGDSLLTAIAAFAYGATRTLLVDAGDFATREIEPYQEMAHLLAARGLRAPDVSGARSLDEVLRACNASYMPRGLQALREIPSGSVDLVWSQAVLEHVRRSEFEDTLREMRRIMAPSGVASHRIDLKDHLGGALNSLRFSAERWESPGFAARSGFYTNRIRHAEMVSLMAGAGFHVVETRVERWPALPTPRHRIHADFASLPEDDLLISGFDVVLRRSDP